MRDKSELAWTLGDYIARDEEAPARIESNPEMCEGELMSDEEVAQYVEDGVKVLLVLNDKSSPRFDDVQAAFFEDLRFLASIGRISDDDYNELIQSDNYRF